MTAKAIRARRADFGTSSPRTLDIEARSKAMAASQSSRLYGRQLVEAALTAVVLGGRTPLDLMIEDPMRRPLGLRRLDPDAVALAYHALDLEIRVCAVAELIGYNRDGMDTEAAKVRDAYDHLRRYGTLKSISRQTP